MSHLKFYTLIGIGIGAAIGLSISGILKGYLELEPMGLLVWAATGGIISIIIPWLFLDVNPWNMKEVDIELGQVCCAISCAILLAISSLSVSGIWWIIPGALMGGTAGYLFGWIPSKILRMISIWIDYNGAIISIINMAIGSTIFYGYMGIVRFVEHGKVETLLFPIPVVLIFAFIGYIGGKSLDTWLESPPKHQKNEMIRKRDLDGVTKNQILDTIDEVLDKKVTYKGELKIGDGEARRCLSELKEISGINDKRVNKKDTIKGGLRMSDEEIIRKLNEEVEKAVSLYKAKYKGGNLEDARKYLIEAGEALKKDKFEDALELSIKAQLSARPDTEYLLSKGRELAGSAEKSFQSKNYENAIGLWNKAIEEYDRAEELAKERKELEILESVSAIKNRLKENILKTETAIDNQKMLDLVAVGSRDVEKANKLFETKNFDGAKDAYNEGEESYRKALEFAEKRKFADGKAKIEGALKSIETSVEASLLSKGDAMLREAEADIKKKKFAEAEESYSLVIKYLKGLNVSGKKDIESMIVSGNVGLIKAKLEQGKEKMAGAEKLIKSNKNYEAKEAYKASMNFFEGVRDEAIGYKIPNLVDELNNFVHACSQNIIAASEALVKVEDVGGVEPEIVNVNEVGQGRANFRRAEYEKPVPEAVEKIKNKYVDLKYLGGGGFGDVYKARRKDGVLVAVKIPRNLDEKSEDVFFRELKTWEKLKHRNIVQLIKPYLKPEPHIEIEYVDGNSVYEAIKSKSLDEERSCRVAFDIAGGLEYAHSRHIIHGDINPKNVMLNSIGEGKITDFGLAKIVTSSSELSGFTLPYASVEMLEKRMVNEKSDAYQLGLTFYIMLTGNNPFDTGSRFETEERIKNYTPAPPSQCNPRFSDFDYLIMRCLSKTPKDRPSPREFRECIYEIIKKKYSVSLPLTESIQKILTMSCNHAMMSAKANDVAECLRALNYAKGKVRDPEIRQDMKNLIEQVEFRVNNEISMEQFLDKMEIFMKKVEWEG